MPSVEQPWSQDCKPENVEEIMSNRKQTQEGKKKGGGWGGINQSDGQTPCFTFLCSQTCREPFPSVQPLPGWREPSRALGAGSPAARGSSWTDSEDAALGAGRSGPTQTPLPAHAANSWMPPHFASSFHTKSLLSVQDHDTGK